MQKVILAAFQGDAMCFVHVLLNTLDMAAKGMEARIIIEGQAVKLPPELAKPEHVFHELYQKVKTAGLIEGVCQACATKLGSLEAVKAEGLPLLSDMNGHPSLGRYLAAGYTILTF